MEHDDNKQETKPLYFKCFLSNNQLNVCVLSSVCVYYIK